MDERIIAKELLKIVQYMYQNNEIDTETKTRIAQKIKDGMKEKNFNPVKETLKVYAIGSEFKQQIIQIIQNI
jgi:hypothetical protein